MKNRDPKLLLFHAPILRQDMTTPRVMRDVIYALLPATGAGLWYFGLSAAIVIVASILGAVLAEWLFTPSARRGSSLLDSSGVLTGLLLGLTLPPGLPMWMAFLGGFVGIALGKVWRELEGSLASLPADHPAGANAASATVDELAERRKTRSQAS